MKVETAKKLSEFDSDIEVYQDYSGRGMYGSTTTGVVCYSERVLFNALAFYFENLDHSDQDEIDEFQNTLDDLKSLRTDSMGMRTIFY